MTFDIIDDDIIYYSDDDDSIDEVMRKYPNDGLTDDDD